MPRRAHGPLARVLSGGRRRPAPPEPLRDPPKRVAQGPAILSEAGRGEETAGGQRTCGVALVCNGM